MHLRAFILAAGYGTRLRPITEHLPKPLLPLMGRPLLYYIIENLFNTLPISKLALNAHYKAEQIEEFCQNYYPREKIKIFHERELLGTGGALKNAQSLLGKETFLVHNGDIFTEVNLYRAFLFHLSQRPIATLLVRDDLPVNNLLVDPEGRLLGLEGQAQDGDSLQKKGFTGIAFYEPEFLDLLPPGFSSVVDGWLKALKAGYEILTYPLEGAWFDLGTPSAYLRALFHFLKNEGETIYVHPEADAENLQFQGLVSIERRCRFEKKSFLKNVVVLAEDKTISGTFENGILLGDTFVKVREEEFLEREKEGYPIGFGGSERKFYRTLDNLILMRDPHKEELERTIQYNLYLRSKNIRVPEIKKIGDGEVFFEDLGDVSLYAYLQTCRSEEKVKKVYRKVLDEVVKLHTIKIDEKAPPFPFFDYDHFRWETSYFAEKFLKSFCGFKVDKDLESEFNHMAERASRFPKNLIHRDLQSQNIMLKGGRVYFLDYQGARIGPPGYDLASLLWDPYHELPFKVRKGVLRYYIYQRKKIEPDFDEIDLFFSLPILRLQRHLQALGAYANLSLFKGKYHFLKFIPVALLFALEEIELFKDRFPRLVSYLKRAKAILERKGFFEEF